jgi:flavin-dependent dehydrogenase
VVAEYDVAVLGGGPAGAVAAFELANNGLRTILLESQLSPAPKIGETLPPEARRILQSLGIWEAFLYDGHLPSVGICSAWSSATLAERDFIFNPYGCGWQLDRAKFERLLLGAAEEKGVTVVRGESAGAPARLKDMWSIGFGSLSLRASWIVDATGRRSAIGRRMGVPRLVLDRLVSIHLIASSGKNAARDNRTFIEARPDGWWYSALMPDGRRRLAFQTDADFVQDQPWRDPNWFRQKLAETEHISILLKNEGYRDEGPCQLTSAHSGRLRECFGKQWVAAGDAAQSFDPLSGQGILSAMSSGQQVGKAISRACPETRDALISYARSMEDRWKRFLQQRRQIHTLEQRFAHSSFWQRRSINGHRDG